MTDFDGFFCKMLRTVDSFENLVFAAFSDQIG